MITTNTRFEPRVQIQDLVNDHVPQYILEENPKFVDFLRQYYISQEYQGGPADLISNLDQYLKLDNLRPEVIGGTTKTVGITTSGDTTIDIDSIQGFPVRVSPAAPDKSRRETETCRCSRDNCRCPGRRWQWRRQVSPRTAPGRTGRCRLTHHT